MSLPTELTRAQSERLTALERDDVLVRIWDRDHTVWGPQPTEIADRLGWLDAATAVDDDLPALRGFGDELRTEGIDDLVVLGMGGSSLGVEALADALDAGSGTASLQILDSTVPAVIGAVERRCDLEQALFVVASKSGTTVETRALADHFWRRVGQRHRAPGRRFVAVTDPESPLAELARERGFRHLFLNPPDIGGRYSVLSLFGLVPAAAAGLDVAGVLESAERARRACGADVPPAENPAARLGALLAAAVSIDRPFLSLVASSRLHGFCLWAEQLVAESLGKEGDGPLPIVDEPFLPHSFADDRLFVALELGDETTGQLDSRIDRLRGLGHPVLVRRLSLPQEIGAEFLVWELAIAVAGHLLGVNPFDQPNVEAAKRRTREVLRGSERGELLSLDPAVGAARGVEAESTVEAIDGAVDEERPTYVALLVYSAPSDPLDERLQRIRHRLLEEYRLVTTVADGPRYLHSTGQLHKGGRPGGLHVFLVDSDPGELPIPGRPYGFETLMRAQAVGDRQALEESGRRTLWFEIDS